MVPWNMHVRACVLALAALSCRAAPHIDLTLRMDNCASVPGDPPAVTSCAAMTLGCASFIELRLYESEAQGTLGRILGSNCLPSAQLGNPPTLCALQMGHAPLPLLDNLPDGKTVRFRLRALHDPDPTTGCNDDLPGAQAPDLVFDGFSQPVLLDGKDHRVVVELAVCGSCAQLPAACGMGGPCGPQSDCPPPTVPVGFQCCMPTPSPSCLAPGAACSDGTSALLPTGGCCAVCTPAT